MHGVYNRVFCSQIFKKQPPPKKKIQPGGRGVAGPGSAFALFVSK